MHAEDTQLEDIAEAVDCGGGGGKQPSGDDEKEPDAGERTPQRWRDRDERRSQRERGGRQRYRPGPGSTFYSPGMIGTAIHTRQSPQAVLDREIDAIVAAVGEAGSIRREELARRVGARRWGPGRFRQALGEAESEGLIRRQGRTFSPNRSSD